MTLRACNSCGAHILSTSSSCPHCTPKSSPGRKIALAALLGIAMVGCGDKDEDSATSEPAVEPEYGVAE